MLIMLSRKRRTLLWIASAFISLVFLLRSLSDPWPSKVLIISSNPRSGSSFLAELISNSFKNDSRWLYEEPQLSGVQINHRLGIFKGGSVKRMRVSGEEKVELLRDFFHCNLTRHWRMMLSDQSRPISFRKPKFKLGYKSLPYRRFKSNNVVGQTEQSCLQVDQRLVKTIRLSLQELLLHWDFDEDPNLKVVLLHRDPRAVLNSLHHSPEKWDSKMTDVDSVCARALDDYQTFKAHQHELNVIHVKYEELTGPQSHEVIAKLTSFLDLESTPDVLEMRGTTNPEDPAWKKYFGTVREANFDPNAWRNQIDLDLLSQIESSKVCQEVLAELGYDESRIFALLD